MHIKCAFFLPRNLKQIFNVHTSKRQRSLFYWEPIFVLQVEGLTLKLQPLREISEQMEKSIRSLFVLCGKTKGLKLELGDKERSSMFCDFILILLYPTSV